ncbi:MAG: hypothetical protein QOF53_2687 [Nocardioidaceae bacterium]|jgi:hypothetical protein|nr:hypothetical protein [Nocardioidaceae bacterium]
MLFALLAAFLLRQPVTVQAVVLGLCTGLFVTTAAEAHDRTPVLSTVVLQVLGTAVVAGSLFVGGSRTRLRRQGADPDDADPAWLYWIYSAIWLAGIAAALYALFGGAGFKVAALAIVPLVLLAPSALQGLRLAALALVRTPA